MYYGYNWFGTEIYPHPQKSQWHNEKPVNSWQTFFSLLIFVSFIALFINWPWLGEHFKERQKNIILPGTPAYEETITEIFQVMEQVKNKVKNGNLGLKEAVFLRNYIIDLHAKIEQDWTIKTSFIMDEARKCFVNNWQPPEETPERFKKLFAKDDSARREHAEIILNRHITQALAEAPHSDCMKIADIDWFAFGFWFLKWYYLLVFPSLFCLLLNIWFAEKSFRAVIEKVYFDCREVFYASCFGPIGLGFVSETANTYRRYNRLQYEYLAKKPYGYQLSRAEENALWLQVNRPVLAFEEALQNVADGYVYRPALACFLVWLTGFSLFSLGKSNQAVAAVSISATVSDEVIELPREPVKFQVATSNSLARFISSLNAIVLPPMILWESAEVVMVKEEPSRSLRMIYLNSQRPRGPPAAVKEDDESLNHESSLNCAKQKRRRYHEEDYCCNDRVVDFNCVCLASESDS
jgi:hypothetical protein